MMFYLFTGSLTSPATGGKSAIAGDRAAAIATEVPAQGSPALGQNHVANRGGWNAVALHGPATDRRTRSGGSWR